MGCRVYGLGFWVPLETTIILGSYRGYIGVTRSVNILGA